MAEIHFLKLTDSEAVVKCYKTDSAGGNVDIYLSTLAINGQTFDANTANVAIQEIYWGCKSGKQLDITRFGVGGNISNTHSHYYLINSGYYDYNGFVDNVYANSGIRINGDGPFHAILKLRKTSGY